MVESGHALAELLPGVAYRQWVCVLPKRLRYFVHRDARLPGEISRILAETLTAFYRGRCRAPKDAAPAQFHGLQRFGSSVNLHLHDHAVVSDGVFSLKNGVLRFHRAPPPSASEVAALIEGLRHAILRRMLRLRAVPEATIASLLSWPHSGFCLDAGTLVEAADRSGLERLLLYVLRPALSLKQLTYKPETGLVRCRPTKGRPDSPAVLERSGVEFVERLAALIPPPRKHMVRYYGALGPRSALRRAVGSATWDRATGAELEASRALAASTRSWAACVRRVFEVDPVLCVKCGGEMKLAAIVLDDGELDRILAHQGWPASWPKTKPARAPPARAANVTAAGGRRRHSRRREAWVGENRH